MKKFAILTSVLALAACGGGSHHHGGPTEMSAIDSNSVVTDMNSFVVIGGNNPTVNPNGRRATNQSDGGIRYDLEDVALKTIPTSGVITDLIFHTDANGKIISIEIPEAQAIMDKHKSASVTVGEMMRKGDTNIFIAKPGQIPNMKQTDDMTLKYVSYAKEAGQGLKYTDFGMLVIDTSVLVGADEETYYMPFAGGFATKNISDDQMKNLAESKDISFTGLAQGSVIYSNQVTNTAESDKLVDSAATLTFAQDGSQILAADFKNWAKIEAVKAENGNNQFKVIESYVLPTSKLHIETSPAELEEGKNITRSDYNKADSMAFQTGYFGDNNTPNEAVGLVQYQYMYGLTEDDYEHHVNVDLGFGGTKN